MGCHLKSQPQDVSTSAVAIERNEDLTSSQKYDSYVNVDKASIQSLKSADVLGKISSRYQITIHKVIYSLGVVKKLRAKKWLACH